MTDHSISKRTAYLSTGGLGILLSAGYLAMATQLPLGEMDAPGAGLFPVLVGAIMCFASLATVWEGWKTPHADGIELPVGQDRTRLFKLIVLLALYFTAMPWLGYSLSSWAFALLLMRLLSTLSWWRCGAYAALMTGVIYFCFIYLLKVPMPSFAISF
jgi:putative tricarboxylic transport membrane protein